MDLLANKKENAERSSISLNFVEIFHIRQDILFNSLVFFLLQLDNSLHIA